MAPANNVWECCFTARVAGGRPLLALRIDADAARPLPAPDNLLGFCFPLGAAAARPSAFLVTEEFSFTLTGGDGERLHGFCRKTNDPTAAPGASAGRAAGQRFPQVLEVLDALLRSEGSAPHLPPAAPAARFLAALAEAAGGAPPPLGAVVRVPLPQPLPPRAGPLDWAELRMRRALPGDDQMDVWLRADASALELELPPELGTGPANAGISLARLLFYLTPRGATSLVASLLLERRVLLVSRSADTVSAAVHAAAALLHPLRWQHIFLPLLPLGLRDYLAAPMPYLVGIQAECLPLLRGLDLADVVMIDLDTLGASSPPLGSPGDDAWQLPWAEEMTDAFDFVRDHIRNPGEFTTTRKASEMVQAFLLKLLWRYRQHIVPETQYDAQVAAAAAAALQAQQPSHRPSLGRLSAGAAGLGSGSSSSSLARSRGNSGRELRGSTGSSLPPPDDCVRAHGYVFDWPAFLAASGRHGGGKAGAFLRAFRHSQMFEQFIVERLRWAAEGWPAGDPFEAEVAVRTARHAAPMTALGDVAKGKLGAFVRKASSAIKQGSSKLVDGLRARGESREAELATTALHRRSTSAGNMQRLSAGPAGSPLHRPSPSAGAIGGTGGGMRTSGSNSSLHSLQRSSAGPRSSAAVAALELQATKADVFFRDDGDDADSLASEGSCQDAGGSSSARGGLAVRDRGHGSPPGPLETGAMTRNRSFTSLFRTSPSPSASSLQQQQQQQQQRQNVGSSRSDAAATPALISLAPGKEGAASSMVNVAAAAGAAASQPLLPASPVKAQQAPDAQQQWADAFTNQYSPLGTALLRQLTTIKSEGSSEWTTFASAASAGEAAEAAAAAAAHSPMGQAVAGRDGAATAQQQQQPAHRHTGSTGSLQSKLSVTADAFSGLVIDAAADAEQQIVRRSSTQEHASAPASAAASPRQQQAAAEPPLTSTLQRNLSTTVSWGDWAAAWDGTAAGPGNGSGLPTITEGRAAAAGEGGVRHSRSQSAL